MKNQLSHHTSEALGLLLMRFGCAWFIMVWAINKFLAPGQYIKLAKYFDGIDLALTQVYIIAAIQVVICLLVFIGWARVVSYAALAAMHAFTIYRQLPQFFDPFEINDNGFPVNRNATVSICAMTAMLALWLLRHRDHWSLDEWLAKRRR